MRAAAAVAAAVLAGCAGPLKSTLPGPAPAGAAVGAPAPAWPAAEVDAERARLSAELERRIASHAWTVPVQLAAADGALRLRLGAEESFAPDSAQLRPAALAVYAELAAVIAARPAVVTHVLVHGDATATEPATDLTARRATSVQHYLASRGIPATRLRAEGRGAAEPVVPPGEGSAVANRRVELVLQPVIAGRERDAWMPPPPIAPCEPCGAE